MYDFAIVGGGIVGLSTGISLSQCYPNAHIFITPVNLYSQAIYLKL